MDLDCDVLVVGAGCGGVAAALAATGAGRRVVLTEPTGWVGGQLTSQAVPPDEHPWVETTGSTRTYRRMREAARAVYRADPRLASAPRDEPHLNPGRAWVSALAAEPAVFHRVLLDLLAPARRRGLLRLLTGHQPTAAYVDRDRVEAVDFDDTAGGGRLTVSARHVLDATEEGDLLPLAGCEHVLGAESSDETGEPHALRGPADPWDQQAITWCAALELRAADAGGGDGDEDGLVDRPAAYDFWRSYRAAHWPGPQLGWVTAEPETGGALRRPLFGGHGGGRGGQGGQDLWSFRRIRYGGHYDPALTDVTVVNWPQVDYWLAPLTGATAVERARVADEARELTRCFVHWLQAEAPRAGGGHGHPEVRLARHALGTGDGLAMRPYVREARRIRAQTTVLEQHVGVEARAGAAGAAGAADAPGAAEFADSVGVGSYRIDLHPSTAGRGYVDIAAYPFQIPLGALLPRRLGNLLAAGKCLGVTHVTNGCYRLHPVEWNVGEAAGTLAAFCLDRGTTPTAVRQTPGLLSDLQRLLQHSGVPLRWPEDIRRRPR